MNEKIKVLMVMPEHQTSALQATPKAESLEMLMARSCEEARGMLAYDEAVDVVLADLTLEDGNWWSVYQDLARRDIRAEMIVIAPRRGLDVSEILAHGVYAVLSRPLDAEDILHTIEEAAARTAKDKGPQAQAAAGGRGNGANAFR